MEAVPHVAGVRLSRNSPIVFVDAGQADLAPGDHVLVKLPGDPAAKSARVAIAPSQLLNPGAVSPTGKLSDQPTFP